MRLIDADVLIDFIDLGHLRSPSEICFSEFDVVDMLEDCATVDAVEVVHGERNETADCSVCGMPAPTDDRIDFINIAELNYCPYCGAKMDGCDDEET